MRNARTGSETTARTYIRGIRGLGRRPLVTAALLTALGLLVSTAGPAWSEAAQTPATAATQLNQMQQTLEKNRGELARVRDKLVWAQELLQHTGETLQLAQAQHEQTLAVQHALEQQLAAVRAVARPAPATNPGELERYRAEIVKLREEREQLRRTLAARDQQLSRMEDKLRTSRSSLQRAEEDAAGTRRNLDNVHAQYQNCQGQWARFSNKLDALNRSVAAAQQTLATTMHTRNLLQSRLSACNSSLTRVRASFASMESAVQQQAPSTDLPAVPNDTPAEITAPEMQDETRSQQDSAPCHEAGNADTPAPDCAGDPDVSLKDVKFRYDSAELMEASRTVLDRVAENLIRQASVSHEVAGHTDSQGDTNYNLWLSLQRANAVRDYLIARGVERNRLVARGYGGSQPVADNSTWEGLVANRRVELRVIQLPETAKIDTALINTAWQGR